MCHEHIAMPGIGKWSNGLPRCAARTIHGQTSASLTQLRLRAKQGWLCTSGREQREFANFGNGSGNCSSNRNRILATEAAILFQQGRHRSWQRRERCQLETCSGNCGGKQFANTGSTDPQNNPPTICKAFASNSADVPSVDHVLTRGPLQGTSKFTHHPRTILLLSDDMQ